jgi:NAD+ kinase
METTEQLLYYPIPDLCREKAQELKKQIASGVYDNLITDDEDKANAYLVGWGDGFMLDAVKKHYDFSKTPEENKPFFWVNCGTLWFLLNDTQVLDDLPVHREDVEIVKAHLMKVEMIKTDTSKEINHAINDVVVGGKLLAYFKFDISSSQINKRFHGTGVMIATALWSSAYRLNNWGPLMPAGSKLWGISGLAALPFDHTIVRPDTITIKIKWRTPVMVGVDGYGWKVDDVESLTISPTTDYATIMFRNDISFDTKRMLLAEQKLLRDDF